MRLHRSKEEVFERVFKKEVKYINILFTNLNGRIHLVSIPSSELEDAIEHGIGFDGSSAGFVGVEVSDLILKPDPNTFVTFSREGNLKMGVMVGEIYCNEKKFELDPRNILRKAVKKLKDELGTNIEYMVSPEMEFWLFRYSEKNIIEFHDDAGYFSPPPRDKGYEIKVKIANALKEAGIYPVKIHHEVPPGKHEIDFKFGDVLHIADVSIIYKFIIKNIAADYGLIASFMPKPFHGQYGAGMHTHQSLMDIRKSKNLFYGSVIYNLSETALHFIGGLIKHARSIAVLTNPTVNSYKRLVPGWEAPVYISWAKYNRSALIRVPMTTDPDKVRIEYRATDGSCNPYLAFAAMLLSGLDGIINKVEPPPPIEENIYKMSDSERRRKGISLLPSTLEEALKEAEKASIVKEILGKKAYNKYLEIKWKEWREYSVTVHEWERRRYLDV